MKRPLTPKHDAQAIAAIREAMGAYTDPTRNKAPVALVTDTAATILEALGVAPDVAADRVARAWDEHFDVKGAV